MCHINQVIKIQKAIFLLVQVTIFDHTAYFVAFVPTTYFILFAYLPRMVLKSFKEISFSVMDSDVFNLNIISHSKVIIQTVCCRITLGTLS